MLSAAIERCSLGVEMCENGMLGDKELRRWIECSEKVISGVGKFLTDTGRLSQPPKLDE